MCETNGPGGIPGGVPDTESPALPNQTLCNRKLIEALNRMVSDDEFADWRTISGPAW